MPVGSLCCRKNRWVMTFLRLPTGRMNQQPAPRRLPTGRRNQQPAPRRFPTGRRNHQPAPRRLATGRRNQQSTPRRLPTGRRNQQSAPRKLATGRRNHQPAPRKPPTGRRNHQSVPRRLPTGRSNQQLRHRSLLGAKTDRPVTFPSRWAASPAQQVRRRSRDRQRRQTRASVLDCAGPPALCGRLLVYECSHVFECRSACGKLQRTGALQNAAATC